MNILFLIIGILLGVGGLYFYLNPKIKTAQVLDEQTLKQNEQLKLELIELNKEQSSLIAKKEEILSNLSILQKQAEETSKVIYKKSYELANEKMNQAAETLSYKYTEAEEEAKKEYLAVVEDCVNSFQKQINSKKEELNKINKQLIDLASKFNSAVEANKRAEELKTKQDFYRLQLSSVDVEEIAKLREASFYLRDKEPLNKIIWKVYYEKPYTALIGRVLGTKTHIGIYKITNIENQMCYIGQAVNIAERWKQHIKRGIGAEAPTRNKLYPAMLEKGVENFTFEIVEECERSKLNEREDYWQEFFHAKDFGYSIK